MKRWITTGILTVLMCGMVFMSGCTTPETPGPAPVTTPTPQIVTETVLITPPPSPTTPAPIPASPTPTLTTPIPTPTPTPTLTPVPATAVPTVTASGYDESKYKDYNPALEASSAEGGSGTLFIHTGGLGEGLTAFIVPNGVQNSGELLVNILPDGCSEGVNLAPGNYIAYLPDKYGGQSEQQSFFIGPNSLTYISFSGYSYRASSGGGCGG
jgi:hypothetical protein